MGNGEVTVKRDDECNPELQFPADCTDRHWHTEEKNKPIMWLLIIGFIHSQPGFLLSVILKTDGA